MSLARYVNFGYVDQFYIKMFVIHFHDTYTNA